MFDRTFLVCLFNQPTVSLNYVEDLMIDSLRRIRTWNTCLVRMWHWLIIDRLDSGFHSFEAVKGETCRARVYGSQSAIPGAIPFCYTFPTSFYPCFRFLKLLSARFRNSHYFMLISCCHLGHTFNHRGLTHDGVCVTYIGNVWELPKGSKYPEKSRNKHNFALPGVFCLLCSS